MRNISKYLAIVVIVTVFGIYSNAATRTQTPVPTQPAKVFQGTLVKVDTDMHMLTAKDAKGEESSFTYTDDTKVIGPTKDVEGLSGQTGAKLKIAYQVEGESNRATSIEVLR